jgi:hypothetical protein
MEGIESWELRFQLNRANAMHMTLHAIASDTDK